jgi:putative membrane protein
MSSWLISHFLWIKAIHVIAVISWMAGLLYLPRLFVYHCRAERGSEMSEMFKLMEYRLARYIMTPAMIASFLFGLLLLFTPGVLSGGGTSLLVKLFLVVLLTGMHTAMMIWRRAFAEDRNQQSERFFRIANEIPTLLMIGIVIAVIVRPL